MLYEQALLTRNFAQFEKGKQRIAQSLEEVNRLGDNLAFLSIQVLLGAYLVYNKQFDEGRKLLLNCLELNNQLDVKSQLNVIYAELGYVAFKLGDLDKAQAYFQHSLLSGKQTNNPFTQTKALGYLARNSRSKKRQSRESSVFTRRPPDYG